MMLEQYGNAGSVTHAWGHVVRDAVEHAREQVAASLGASASEIIFTSGATESNNLAIRGLADHPRRRGHRVISMCTEHRAVLDPLKRLEAKGHAVTLLRPHPQGDLEAGRVDLRQLLDSIDEETFLVSVMLANNEIGVLQPIAQIGAHCRAKGVTLHCDATQAVGHIDVDVQALQVDLLSFSAHKFHGPQGVGGLYVRRRGGGPRLSPLLEGGGQEGGFRGGTLNAPGIVGMGVAIEICREEFVEASQRQRALRNRLLAGILNRVPDVALNGPPVDIPGLRIPNNLNLAFTGVTGEALMLELEEVALSSGSACTSANPEPSHVLRGLGLDEDRVRSSLRFGLSRFTTDEEIDHVVARLAEVVPRLRKLG